MLQRLKCLSLMGFGLLCACNADLADGNPCHAIIHAECDLEVKCQLPGSENCLSNWSQFESDCSVAPDAAGPAQTISRTSAATSAPTLGAVRTLRRRTSPSMTIATIATTTAIPMISAAAATRRAGPVTAQRVVVQRVAAQRGIARRVAAQRDTAQRVTAQWLAARVSAT